MNTKPLIADIDAEIAKLQAARAMLVGLDSTSMKKKSGRPVGSSSKSVPGKPKRTMSPAGKARIAAAQKKRWAAVKKAAKQQL